MQHDRIEQNGRMASLLSDDLTRDAYRALLARLYGFLAPLEDRLGRRPEWARLGFDFDARRRVPMLRRDLAVLGGPAVDDLPVCDDLPAVAGFAAAVGSLYVLEGATLGGRIIARHLHRTLGLDAASGAAFFCGRSDDTGALWRAFGRFAERTVSPAEADAAVAAAAATFDTMNRWLSL